MAHAFTHLDAIELRLSHERERARIATKPRDREWREHNVRMIERERDQEIAFLKKQGVEFPTLDEMMMSDDELLRELTA